jgi:hypothetical protein
VYCSAVVKVPIEVVVFPKVTGPLLSVHFL